MNQLIETKKMQRKYIILCSLGVIVVILALTNPSVKNLKEHVGRESDDKYDITFRKVHNYILFSTFEVTFNLTAKRRDWIREAYFSDVSGKYTGIFLNFYK